VFAVSSCNHIFVLQCFTPVPACLSLVVGTTRNSVKSGDIDAIKEAERRPQNWSFNCCIARSGVGVPCRSDSPEDIRGRCNASRVTAQTGIVYRRRPNRKRRIRLENPSLAQASANEPIPQKGRVGIRPSLRVTFSPLGPHVRGRPNSYPFGWYSSSG
jgi:hypothetical protein